MRGKTEFERFKKGERLTHKQAILAQCYVCNGLDEGGEDCKGASCPLHQFMPYRKDKKKIRTKQGQVGTENLKRYRDAQKG